MEIVERAQDIINEEIHLDNYHPNCVNLKLDLVAGDLEYLSILSRKQKIGKVSSTVCDQSCERLDGWGIHLSLHILFGEETLSLRGGNVRFGIRRGELHLYLEGARCPVTCRNFVQPLPSYIAVEREVTTETGVEARSKERVSAKIGMSNLSAGIQMQGGETSTRVRKERLKFSARIGVVSAQGPDDRPIWVFESQPGERVLKGGISDDLCCVQSFNHKCTINVFFEVRRPDIIITNVEGVYPKSLKRDTIGVINAVIRKWILKQVKRVMSEGRIRLWRSFQTL